MTAAFPMPTKPVEHTGRQDVENRPPARALHPGTMTRSPSPSAGQLVGAVSPSPW